MPDISRVCTLSGEAFVISEEEQKFYEKAAPRVGDTSYPLPLPTLCPLERMQRRLCFRNARSLYTRKCAATGENVISMFDPEGPHTIYKQEYWWKGEWDPMSYGKDFDFSRSFFDQFQELYIAVPKSALDNDAFLISENSEYTNYSVWNKNCYLIFYSDHNQDCLYMNACFFNKDCMEGSYSHRCQLSYEFSHSLDCYNCKFIEDCKKCTDCWFMKNCIGCRDCFGCVNMRNKQYCFFNEQLSKDAYFQKLETYQLGSISYIQFSDYLKSFYEFSSKFPYRYYEGVNNENVTGNYINNSKNVFDSFHVLESQDSRYIYDCQKCKDCFDMDGWGGEKGAVLSYECETVGEGVSNIYFSRGIQSGCYNVFYSDYCLNNSHDLFGCIALRQKQYCVLNKQYSKEDYERLVQRIIEHMKETGEWGEFFKPSLSPFAYNETVAYEYFPLDQEGALQRGYLWKEKNLKEYQKSTYIIPESIQNVPDTIVKEILSCAQCGKNYKITSQELAFYKKAGLPIPLSCNDCRNRRRLSRCNPRRLWNRNCAKCSKAIQTSYAPERSEMVYCEECYLEAAY